MAEQACRKRYGRWLAVFFLAAASCTIVSRAADSATIPVVTVQKAEQGRITHRLEGSGTVKTKENSTVLLPEGCLVEFCLEDGTSIKKGDVLIRFQMEHLRKRREELEQAWREAALALEQAELSRQEDAWIPAVEEAGRALAYAQAEHEQAQGAYGRALVEADQMQEAWEQAGEVLAQAQEAYEEAQEELAQVREAYEEAREEAYEEAREEAQEELARAQEAYEEAQEELARAQEAYEEASQSLAQAREGAAQADQGLTGAGQALAQSRDAYQAAERSDAVTRQNNAKVKKAAGLDVEGAQLIEAAAKARLAKTEELLAGEGKLLAEEDGIFQNTNVTAGTVTSGSEFICIGTGGLLFTAEVPAAEKEKLAPGDPLTVKLPGMDKCKASVTSLAGGKGEDGREVLLLTAALPEEGEMAVGQASFSLEKRSEERYEAVLPLTAIRQDSKGYYCLGIQTRSAILGEEQRAQEIRLTLLDQDDTRAAVEGAILPDTQIIVSSGKPVEDQDRVRVER